MGKSNGRNCEGEHPSVGTKKCTLSTKRRGQPKVMSKPCSICHEYRCRDHCRCARKQQLSGRSKGRGGVKASASSSSSSSSSSSLTQPVVPVGRAPAPSTKLLSGAKEMTDMACKEIEGAIENCWKELRDRLNHTMPTHLEPRDDFVKRLHAAVKWLNQNRADQLRRFCTNQKERARECLQQDPPGGRTSH